MDRNCLDDATGNHNGSTNVGSVFHKQTIEADQIKLIVLLEDEYSHLDSQYIYPLLFCHLLDK